MFKRFLFSLSLILVSLTVHAQVSLGVKGGVDLAKLSFKDDVFNSTNRLGWFAGPTLNIPIPLPGMSIDLSALYAGPADHIFRAQLGQDRVDII